MEPYLHAWWREAKPKTSGEHPHFWQSWQNFVFAWEEAETPFGETMRTVSEEARPSDPPQAAVARYGAGSLRTLLASFCRELQELNGGEYFFLTGRDAGPLLGVSDVQAWRWLRRLESDQIIETLKKYPRGKRKATEYRFVG